MMKNYKQLSEHNVFLRLWIMIFSIILNSSISFSQEYLSISGIIEDNMTREAIPYANISLFTTSDSTLTGGQISDSSGYFRFRNIPAAEYHMLISMAGYEKESRTVKVNSGSNYNAGIILLKARIIGIGETVITADRLKGKSEKDRTIYFVTNKMTGASSTGLDVLKHVPGIQVDLKRNISLEGSRNIMILVNGMERDNNFLSQIMPELIDRIEILSVPTSMYDGNITGVINIILKKEKNLGIGGHINLEIPGGLMYYVHPDYSISLGLKKLSVYTSYNGEMISFDQHESLQQKYLVSGDTMKSNSIQYIRQILWSHRFHYGMDFPLSSKSSLNFYGFFNPYSQKYSGIMETLSDKNPESWQASRVSEDFNKSTSYSLFFKHMFNDKGNDLSADISNYHYRGEYSATYTPLASDQGFPTIVNDSRPDLNSLSVRIDMNGVLSQNLSISTGLRLRLQKMKELKFEDFKYVENIYAAYFSFAYSRSSLDISSGIRIEKSVSVLKKTFSSSKNTLLPFAMLNLKISSDKTLKLGFNNTVYRPNLYQLNPLISMDNPNNVRHGNPSLDPEIRTLVFAEYSRKYNVDYLSARLFYNQSTHVISNLSFVNDTSVIETRIDNAGKIIQTGLQFSGTFKIGTLITFIPYLRLYGNYSITNNQAKSYSIENRDQFVVEPGFSSIVSLKHDINFSFIFQYASRRNSIQTSSFGDALYIASLEKLFLKQLKAGVAVTLPFSESFTYQGSEIISTELQSKYEGEIHLSRPLIWFKLGLQFNTGKRLNNAGKTADESEMLPKKN